MERKEKATPKKQEPKKDPPKEKKPQEKKAPEKKIEEPKPKPEPKATEAPKPPQEKKSSEKPPKVKVPDPEKAKEPLKSPAKEKVQVPTKKETPSPPRASPPKPPVSPRQSATPAPRPEPKQESSARDSGDSKVSRQDTAQPLQPVAPGNTAGGGGENGGGASLGVLNGLVLPEYYARQAIAAIAANFRVPEQDQADAYCQIAFIIQSDGTISSPRVIRSSGSVKLDTMAVEALNKTARLAPLPDGLRVDKVEAQLTFSFKAG